MHISEETVSALQIDKGRLERAEKLLVGQMMMLEAQYPLHSVIPNNHVATAIEVTQQSIEILHTVLRFEHDVLSAYRYAPQ